ncbi:p-loop containing nucleoside triphosphate hydrolase protein [Diplodia corticola]|uniref:p-loop containing nucleoside triphosphate hydrolase protein n=1 Tax=Diplodia corticola TaxID=236234 RepID=A0A1J9RQJ5_9PEZI|nr:p-loop containing nucleoside triphosphate hydrolase protein [Diplodia corticola]OJD30719.1 p-loop containing nucleoside triphosphate hydrolase protein [Diplodia corticola]
MNLADQQNIHPFFAKPHGPQASEHANDPDSAPTNAAPQDENQPNVADVTKKSQAKGRPLATRNRTTKRKTNEGPVPPKVKQASIAAFAGLKKEGNNIGDVSEATSLDEDPNAGRRKRQRTNSPFPEESTHNAAECCPGTVDQGGKETEQEDQPSWIEQLETEAERIPETVEVKASSPKSSAECVNLADLEVVPGTSPAPMTGVMENRRTPVPPSSPPVAYDSPAKSQRTPKKDSADGSPSPSKPSPPKKMLRMNAKGRFSSPVPKESRDEAPATINQRKTRSRANKKGPKQLVVKISYIKDDERAVQMAEDIDNILAGVKRAPEPKTHVPAKVIAPPKVAKPPGPPKPTHPFFTGKTQRRDVDVAEFNQSVAAKPAMVLEKVPSRRETAITPGKLRAQARAEHESLESQSFSMFGSSTRPRKAFGGAEAPWPWKGVTRVGDGERLDTSMELSSFPSISSLLEERRKLKGMVYKVPDAEAILSLVAQEPHISTGWREDQDATRHSVVRFPQRLLTTSPDIQRRVHSEILSFQQHTFGSEAELGDQFALDGKLVHPALADLFDGIPDELTPFDKGHCETMSWTQKYAPKHSFNVLGSTTEVSVLRRWLQALKVNSVGGALKDPGTKSKKGGATKPPKKKRKKDELDDFIVDDEDVLDDLDELTDPEETPAPDASHAVRKSMVRFGGDVPTLGGGKKLHNLLLLSGPHGSGKTAAVYAVAKELGFEVFEINPGSRRSGKDVLEKIGDMTENHLVQRHTQEQPDTAAVDSDTERLTNAVQKDIESGRQKSMSSFFKPTAQSQAKPKTLPKKKVTAKTTQEKEQPPLIKPRQNQKQSLILLEEVDVLFEDDKNFWQTVEHLALNSRRPVIMTCTDERLFHVSKDSLHAILRMSPASTDLAADYLLLLAAKEGHLLSRKTVSSLYESKSHDLRATITELDFWCQMAVGDRKGGLEWMYQRWPPGKDVDEHGKVLRVASKGTYQAGMGWIERDVLLDENHIGFDREYELMLEMVESWNIEPETFSSVVVPDHPMGTEQTHAEANLRALQDMDRLIDLSSAVDVYCRVDVPTRSRIPMDPTQPLLPEKARTDYIDGYDFLQADTLADFTNFDTHLAVSSHLAARRYVLASSTIPLAAPAALDERNIDKTILDHITSSRQPQSLTRADFYVFDPLAEPPSAALNSTVSAGSVTASSFDRTFRLLAEELAPYVRNIAAHDIHLENERLRISNLLSAGGGKPKRLRTTRAARSALEGGRRENTRRERWFDKSLNLAAVLKTAGKEWAGSGSSSSAATATIGERNTTETGSATSGGDGGSDVEMAG